MTSGTSAERDKLVEELRTLSENMRAPHMKGANHFMELDLTLPQLRVMHLILDLTSAPMSVIANEMGITVSACTHLIDKLVLSGNVERGQDPDDRRIVLCSLTDYGIVSMDKLRQEMPFAQDEFVNRLSVEELRIMVDATTIMQRVMTEMNS